MSEILDFPAVDKEKMTCIFFHGYGASGKDLAFLSKYFKNQHCRFLFPDAFFEVESIPNGRAWFRLSSKELRSIIYEKAPLSDEVFLGLKDVKERLLDLCESFQIKTPLLLGGFSQGAAVSAFLATQTLISRFLILFSGTNIPTVGAQKPKEPSYFFQSHGSKDEILTMDRALALKKTLEDLSWKSEFYSFERGHELPYSIVDKASEFLDFAISQVE